MKNRMKKIGRATLGVPFLLFSIVLVAAQGTATRATDLVVRGKTIHTMDGRTIENGVVVVRDGKIQQVGTIAEVKLPADVEVIEAAVVTPGLIDAHSVVGLAGILNQDEDQDQLESSAAIQPQLRALDAYNAFDPLIEWIRRFGVTTVHTGHAPGTLISGQTMIVKTVGSDVEAAAMRPAWGLMCTLGEAAQASGSKSPGTRGKMVAMLREKFLAAQQYRKKREAADKAAAEKADESGNAVQAEPGEAESPAGASGFQRNLEMEALADCLAGDLKWIVHANRAVDIRNALRLAEEFDLPLVLDGGAEAYLMTDALREAGVPVIVHPSMARPAGERENLTFRNAAILADAGIQIALQSGYEAYVPKTRVVLFEAAVAASHDLGFERALASITIDAAKLLGIDQQVGSITVGKAADLALYDGDPFEYTTHCTGVVIGGTVMPGEMDSHPAKPAD